jgi:hypothetical protein
MNIKQLIFFIKKIYVLSSMILLPIFSSTIVVGNNDKDIIFDTSIDNSAILIVEEITNQINSITIKIKNIGNNPASNVKMTVDINDGFFTYILKKQYEVSSISSSSSASFQINILGFGFGYNNDFPLLKFEINSDNSNTVNGKVSFILIGFYTEIVAKNYNDNSLSKDYTLFCPMWSTTTYLIDKDGNIAHSWESTFTDSQTVYLRDNGNLVRSSLVASSSFASGGFQGRIEIFDWNGSLIWTFEYSTEDYCFHHDLEVLPNGNILLIAWERKTEDEAIENGRNPNRLQSNEIWPDHIIEVKPIGSNNAEIIWEWYLWDHLIQDYDPTKANYGIVSQHPELVDINYGNTRADWTHINSVDYNEELDQILLSVHNFNEIWVIDHSTTSLEAAGHTGGRYGKGGDILYRWGNPEAYDQGNNNDKKFFGQHDARWIDSNYPDGGNIVVFNNGAGRPDGKYSTVDEIIPPIDENGYYHINIDTSFGPEEQTWIFKCENPTDIYSTITSGAQRLSNGNTLICSANDFFLLEVNKQNRILWVYINPYPYFFVNKNIPRAQSYDPDYPGLRYLDYN